MKRIMAILITGAMMLVAASGLAYAAPPDHHECVNGRIALDEYKSTPCLDFPAQLPPLEIQLAMEFPKCAVSVNTPQILASVKGDKAFSGWLKLASADNLNWADLALFHYDNQNQRESPTQRYGVLTDRKVLYPDRVTDTRTIFMLTEKEADSAAVIPGYQSQFPVLEALRRLESESFEYISLSNASDVHPPHADGKPRHISQSKRYPHIGVNTSAHELGARLVQCGAEIKDERSARARRAETLNELVSRHIELERINRNLQREAELQRDLLALTRSIVAEQERIDAAYRELAEARQAGLETRAAIWAAYAATAAEESTQFFAQMQERQDALNATLRQTDQDLAKRDAVRAELTALIDGYEATLDELDAAAEEAAAESESVSEQIQELQAPSE